MHDDEDDPLFFFIQQRLHSVHILEQFQTATTFSTHTRTMERTIMYFLVCPVGRPWADTRALGPWCPGLKGLTLVVSILPACLSSGGSTTVVPEIRVGCRPTALASRVESETPLAGPLARGRAGQGRPGVRLSEIVIIRG
jgi:hypothetical protein